MSYPPVPRARIRSPLRPKPSQPLAHDAQDTLDASAPANPKAHVTSAQSTIQSHPDTPTKEALIDLQRDSVAFDEFFASDSDDPDLVSPPRPVPLGRGQVKRPAPSPSRPSQQQSKTPKTWSGMRPSHLPAHVEPVIVDPRTESASRRQEICTQVRSYRRARIVRIAHQRQEQALLVHFESVAQVSNTTQVSASLPVDVRPQELAPPTPELALVLLQHDWALETRAKEGDMVHLIGALHQDPTIVNSWAALLMPRKHGVEEDETKEFDADPAAMQLKSESSNLKDCKTRHSTPTTSDQKPRVKQELEDMDDEDNIWDSFPQGSQDFTTAPAEMDPIISEVTEEDMLTESQLEREIEPPLTPQEEHTSSSDQRIPSKYSSWHESSLEPSDPDPEQDLVPDPNMGVLTLSSLPSDQGSYLILHPDILLSITRVAASATCVRRAVVQERMRDPFPLPSKAVVMGIMLHEVLQACLLAHTSLDSSSPETETTWPYLGDFSASYVAAKVDEQVSSHRELLFALQIPPVQAAFELHDSVQPFTIFGQRYLAPRGERRGAEDVWGVEDQAGVPLGAPVDGEALVLDSRSSSEVKARVRSVVDVEEDMWSPMWGLKGKVDATILLELDEGERPGLEARQWSRPLQYSAPEKHTHTLTLCPLELKTGRATHVLEHRAQTMLYTLLMSDRYGCDISAGLLFYSQTNQLHRVRRVPQEVKALIMARNSLASYLIESNEGAEPKEEPNGNTSGPDSPESMEEAFETAPQDFRDKSIEEYFTAPTVAQPVLSIELEKDAWDDQKPPTPSTDAKGVLDCEDFQAFGVTASAVAHAERLRPQLLPEPIDESFQCTRCYALDQCALYRIAHDLPPPNSKDRFGLEEFEDKYRDKVQALLLGGQSNGGVAGAFFRKWDTILSLEHAPLAPARAALWTQTPTERQRRGTALTNLNLDPSSPSEHPGAKGMYRFTATLVPASPAAHDADPRGLMAASFSVGDPVLLSVPPALLSVAQGFILFLSPDKIVVGMDHALLPALRRARADRLLNHPDDTQPIRFCLDRDELTGGTSRLRANLARLLLEPPAPAVDAEPDVSHEASYWAAKQRASIVYLTAPHFISQVDPRVQHGMALVEKMGVQLNSDQKKAIEQVLRADDYALVQGMPGTGKTTLIAVLCRVLAALGFRVVVGAYTHSALDTVLAKVILEGLDGDPDDPKSVHLLRLGAPAKAHPTVRPYTTDALARLEGDALEQRLAQANVIGTTALSAHHPLLGTSRFDYVILDEAAQATLPAALGPLLAGHKFVLVGDEYQLPPLVKSDRARRAGGQVSLFALLKRAHPEAVVPLRLQYRMNQAIMQLANVLTYQGQLRCALPQVAEQRISLPFESKARESLHRTHDCGDACWLTQALNPSLQAALLDTDLVSESEEDKGTGGRGSNAIEARLCAQLVLGLILSGAIKAQGVALVTPYRQQVGLLLRALSALGRSFPATDDRWWEHVEVLTADRAQGKDKAVVIVSMVRTVSMGLGQLLRDERRINVALTRAQKKLLVVGSVRCLSRDTLLAQMVQTLPVVPLPRDADGLHGVG